METAVESCMGTGMMVIPWENCGKGDNISLKYRGSCGDGGRFCGNTAAVVSGSHGIDIFLPVCCLISKYSCVSSQ